MVCLLLVAIMYKTISCSQKIDLKDDGGRCSSFFVGLTSFEREIYVCCKSLITMITLGRSLLRGFGTQQIFLESGAEEFS